MAEGKRINNTRDRGGHRGPLEPKLPQPKPIGFSEYASLPDSDGYVCRHMTPVGYYCRTVNIFIENTSGARVQFRVGDDFVERQLTQGLNVLQVERALPPGERLTMRIVEGSVAGIWVSWLGLTHA